MGLFTQSQIDQINKVAEKSKNLVESKKTSKNIQSMNQEIQDMSNKVVEYFKDSNSILITSPEDLHDYVTKAIESGYCGIDTETTGLDRQKDTIVGASLYYPGSFECYIPSKHIVPIFDEPYKNQLSYDIIGKEFQRFVDAGTKMIFANADFDLSMIYKDLGVDMVDICYYDVILAWRCLKEDERDNSLKGLYMKYVMKGKGDPMKFSDFFSPALFPYCRPEVAKLYAANDAKITYELFKWQLPYTLKEHPKCIKNNLQHIADLIWTVEFPMIKICQEMHRTGIFLDDKIANTLKQRYKDRREVEAKKLSNMVNDIIVNNNYIVAPFTKPPFVSGDDFNCNSPMHVKHLLYNIMNIPEGKKGKSTDKAVLNELNLPITEQILKVRSLDTLINSFVKKLPQVKGKDNKIHARFNQIGANTGRMCIAKGTNITLFNTYHYKSYTRPIEHVCPGDVVYCYDKYGYWSVSKVLNLWKTGDDVNCLDVTYSDIDGNLKSLICTPEHLILTPDNVFKRADELKLGDKIVCLNLNAKRYQKDDNAYIVQSVKDGGKHDVYDIEVDYFHNFIANGVCVHNSSADPNLQNVPSHADDIRHMFRATPQQHHIKNCDNIGNFIHIKLPSYYDMKTPSGYRQVKDLHVGDDVVLLKDREEYTKKIVDIVNSEDVGNVDIFIQKEGELINE